MTKFAKLNSDGSLTEVREIDQNAMLKCRHVIMVAEHYREDGTCRCNDPNHKEMASWGYTWQLEGWN